MAKVAGAQNFDGRNWYEQHIAMRTRAALEEQDRAFAERHAGDTLPELACYLRRCAGHWHKLYCRAVRQLVGCSAGGAPESRVWASAQSVEWPVSARDEAPDRVVPGGAGRKTGGTGKEKSGAPAGQHRTGGGQAGGRALRGRTDGSGPLRGADREITFGKHVAESAASL